MTPKVEALPTDVYYGGIDPRQTTGALKLQQFERQLVSMVLFDHRILITDSFFFNSSTLLNHVAVASKRSHESLFEAAIARGLVVPTVRQPSDNFVHIAEYLIRDGATGLLSHDDIAVLAAKFVVESSRRDAFVDWPKPMGARYLQLLRENLSEPMLPPTIGGSSIDPDLWRATHW